ncbi:MAG: hypothetical protein ACI82A_003843 [Candidatus Azotimanducaceae bacterium]
MTPVNVCNLKLKQNNWIHLPPGTYAGNHVIRNICTLITLLALGACTSISRGIDVTNGEGIAPPSLKSFHVVADQIPAFLGPIIVSNFSVAMAERGMQPVSEGGDAVATLRLEQVQMLENRTRDDFDERIEEGGETRFMARIIVEIRVAKEDKVLWQGSVQRLHTVRPGDFMHTGRASVSFLEAFRELLEDYPAPDSASDSNRVRL